MEVFCQYILLAALVLLVEAEAEKVAPVWNVVSRSCAPVLFGPPSSAGWSMTNNHFICPNPTQIFLVRMLWLLVVCLGLAVGQEVTDEVIDNINEATGLALKYE